MVFLFLIKFIISKSSLFNGLETSKIAKTISLFCAAFLDFSIPILSILSSDSLIPAVSIILKGIPEIEICSSIVSLVVPSISVTIALSYFKNSFNKDDFPAFGLPIIANFIPSFIIFPFSKEFESFSRWFWMSSNIFIALEYVTSSTSYSG